MREGVGEGRRGEDMRAGPAGRGSTCAISRLIPHSTSLVSLMARPVRSEADARYQPSAAIGTTKDSGARAGAGILRGEIRGRVAAQ